MFSLFFEKNNQNVYYLQKIKIEGKYFSGDDKTNIDFSPIKNSIGNNFEIYEQQELKGIYKLIYCDGRKINYEEID